jgi:hypothetical protein
MKEQVMCRRPESRRSRAKKRKEMSMNKNISNPNEYLKFK